MIITALGNLPGIMSEQTKQGVSDNLEVMLAEARKHFEQPISWDKGPMITRLAEIRDECGAAGWDGGSEKPVSLATLQEAELLIGLLPYTAALPNVAPTRAGGIAFEWYGGESNRLMVGLSGSRKISYAALLPGNRQVHGSEPFISSIPESVSAFIARFNAAA